VYVADMMRQSVAFHRDRTALIDEHRTLTYGEAWERGVRLANALIALGVQPGDRVAGLEDNNLGAADLFIGAAIAGAVRVPLYARNSPEAHAHDRPLRRPGRHRGARLADLRDDRDLRAGTEIPHR